MARYGIALGGNKRNFPEWDNLYASGNTAGFIHYAAHLMTRHKVLPVNLDFNHPNWHSWMKQEVAGGALVVGDILDVVWINPGTHVEKIAVHKKNADAATVVTVRLRDDLGAVIGTDFDVQLGALGAFHVQAIGQTFQRAGSVQIVLKTGSLEGACFALMTELVNFYSEYGCACDNVACDVPVPVPTCFDSIR